MKVANETHTHAADVTRGRTPTNRAPEGLQVVDDAGNDFYPTLTLRVGSATDLGNNTTEIFSGTSPVEGIPTDETDTTLVLRPDGTGGTVWGPDAGSTTSELNIEGGQSVIKAHGSMGATETFDPTDGNVHTGTLNANCTFTLSAPTGSGAATLELWITGSGTRTWTWPGSVTWDGGVTGSPPADTQTVRVILETVDGGTNWIANMVGGGGSALTVKDEGGALATAATSLDFVGAGVVASGTGAAKTITIAGSVSTAPHWEILMAGGISSPPEPLENGTGTDWLYAFVP